MYIAFKWLSAMAFAMWLAICGLDVYIRAHIALSREVPLEVMKNASDPIGTGLDFPKKRCRLTKPDEQNIGLLLCLVFIAGAMTVSLFNKKQEIMFFVETKINDIKNIEAVQRFSFQETANKFSVAAYNYSIIIWEKLLNIITNIRCAISSYRNNQKHKINDTLLRKLREMGEENDRLSKFLISATSEIDDIRMQYKLESMAKSRLEQHIENTQKVIKENRSKYVSFQQLYLVTHQENIFLKSRIKRLYREKDEAEKNLVDLMNKIYRSKNSELKAYCSRFMIKTKSNNLLNSDVNAEIEKFLLRSRKTNAPNWQCTGSSDGDTNPNANWESSVNSNFVEVYEDDAVLPLVSNAPKLKGLPGEYVWTVKDKDGIIEKLYEYDIGDLDNGETIQRIRQYSVYHDSDCLLDFTNPSGSRVWSRTELPSTSQGFLTGSEAFQDFLKNNIVCSLPSPPSLCD